MGRYLRFKGANRLAEQQHWLETYTVPIDKGSVDKYFHKGGSASNDDLLILVQVYSSNENLTAVVIAEDAKSYQSIKDAWNIKQHYLVERKNLDSGLYFGYV